MRQTRGNATSGKKGLENCRKSSSSEDIIHDLGINTGVWFHDKKMVGNDSFNHSTLIIEANLSTSLTPQKNHGTEDEGKKDVNPMRISDPMKSKRLRDYALTFHQPSYPIKENILFSHPARGDELLRSPPLNCKFSIEKRMRREFLAIQKKSSDGAYAPSDDGRIKKGVVSRRMRAIARRQ